MPKILKKSFISLDFSLTAWLGKMENFQSYFIDILYGGKTYYFEPDKNVEAIFINKH